MWLRVLNSLVILLHGKFILILQKIRPHFSSKVELLSVHLLLELALVPDCFYRNKCFELWREKSVSKARTFSFIPEHRSKADCGGVPLKAQCWGEETWKLLASLPSLLAELL